MVELGEQVCWTKTAGLLEMARQNEERSDENPIADADGVHIARSIQRRPVKHRWNSQKVKDDWVGTPWVLF